MTSGEDIAAIYDRHARQIYRYIYHRLGQKAVAEDLTSEVFIRFMRSRVSTDAPLAYLYRIAHNLVVDYYRSNPALDLIDEHTVNPADNPARDVEIEAERARLRRAIQRLPADQQQVIVLKFLEGLTHAQIAEILSKPEGAIKSLQHRALANLRIYLGGDEHVGGKLEFAGLLG